MLGKKLRSWPLRSFGRKNTLLGLILGLTLITVPVSEIVACQPDSGPPAILVFNDNPINLPPNDRIGTALSELGLQHTGSGGDIESFFDSLLNEGPWNLVIASHDVTQFSNPNQDFDSLEDYVTGGGCLILFSYLHRESADHNLWSVLGVTHLETIEVPPGGTAAPVYWWSEDHQIFNEPNSVPAFLNLINPVQETWPVQHVVNPIDGNEALGGFTEAESVNSSAIVAGNSYRTVYLGFANMINQSDLDEDGEDDVQELWTNLINWLLRPELIAADGFESE